MKWRRKGTYIEAGEFGGGHEQIIIIKRAGGTYKWTKVTNRAGWARFACAVVWHGQWVAVVVAWVVVVVRAVAVQAVVVVWWVALICLRCLYGHKPTQTPQNSAI